jgi:hypothetical protein
VKFSLLHRGQLAASVAVGLGAIALAGGLPVAASTVAASTVAAAARAPRPVTGRARAVVDNCRHKPEVHPSKFVLTCADADDYLAGLRWVGWRSAGWRAVAAGSGFEHINSCQPNCASGRFRRYRVLVTLWRPRPQSRHHGLLHFTRITVVYDGRRPLVYSARGKARHPQTVTRRL